MVPAMVGTGRPVADTALASPHLSSRSQSNRLQMAAQHQFTWCVDLQNFTWCVDLQNRVAAARIATRTGVGK